MDLQNLGGKSRRDTPDSPKGVLRRVVTVLLKTAKTVNIDPRYKTPPFNGPEGQNAGYWGSRPVSKGCKTVRKDVKTKEER